MGDERIEQATAAPGELRDVDVPYDQKCWRLTGEGVERCHKHYGHTGDCSSMVEKADHDEARVGEAEKR